MRTKIILAFLSFFLFQNNTICQEKIAASPDKWMEDSSKAEFVDGAIHLTNVSGNSAILWLKGMNFKNGVIELDIKGKDESGQSFVGVAFHGNSKKYEAIYFRPFNFKNPERKTHSVQYISIPDYPWNLLREKFPETYEKPVQPVPDPNDWFHARIEIEFPSIKVFVNGNTVPSLVVEQLSKTQEGGIGLWIDSKDGWFRNVVVSKK